MRSDEAILREALERAPVPLVIVWGPELRVRLVNARAAELLPDGADLVGRPLTEVLPEAPGLMAEVGATLTETVVARDIELPSGGRWFTFTSVPVDAGEDGAGLLITARETTVEVLARRELEDDLASEHRIATELQTSLMPGTLPAVKGVDLASGFRPAGDGREIGGDFYDVFPVRDGCWMVTLGDVCGKGAAAATVTALAHYTLRAAAMREDADPCAVLRRLNEALLRQVGDGRFVSVVCAFLEPGASGAVELEVCTAGHLPPLRVSAAGEVHRVSGDHGAVLGVWEEIELEAQSVALAPGERLVLYTDGVLDADPAQELTEARFAELVAREGAAGSAAATVTAIERAVIAGGPPEARDDIALLVLRAAPEA